MRFAISFTLAGLLAILAAIVAEGAGQQPDGPLLVTTLSSRPEFVSGGDALVEISGAGEAPLGDVEIVLNNRDIRAAFHVDRSRRSFVGLVEGLTVGMNTVTARVGGREVTLALTNFPITGPVLSGPPLSPFVCNTVESGLGPPLDDDCSATTTIQYFYKSSAPAAARSPFKPLPDSAGARPADLAETTTIDGNRVPCIVRVESGTIDRAIYRIAVLDNPSADAPTPWAPGAGWNHRLAFLFGGGCGINYTQGINRPADVLVDPVLSRGFALATSTANVFQQYCNDHLSGEALMMIKEHIIERYGLLKWTMGLGGSGGAIQQLLIAQNFPGLLDGLLPSLAFPDAVTIAPSVSDCRLLANVFSRNPRAWTAAKRLSVEGYAAGTCRAWDKAFADVIVSGNPLSGVIGRPLDNVGVQYGLKALNSGTITKAEFLDLNAGIGGFDATGRLRSVRTVADPNALRLAYATGRVNFASAGLSSVPILEYRSYNDAQGDIHDRARDFSVRERLRRANGNADNQVIWVYPNGVTGLGPRIGALALDTMTRWLDGVTKDVSAIPAAQKVRRAKPAAAVDACWDVIGTKISEPFAVDRPGICNALYPAHSNPRWVAGAPVTDDILKCQLKPIDAGDYKVRFTSDESLSLRLIFPTGVCDYSKPGVNQERLAGTYLTAPSALLARP